MHAPVIPSDTGTSVKDMAEGAAGGFFADGTDGAG